MRAFEPPRRLRTGLGALTAAAAVLPAACATSPPTRFHTPDAVTPSATELVAYLGPPVRIRAVRIPPLLDRSQLVEEVAPGRVHVSDLDQWAAPLGLTARQVLTQNLAAILPAGEVLAPDAPAPKLGVDLEVDVVSYGVVGRVAILQASWSVVGVGDCAKGRPPPPLIELRTTVSQDSPASVAEGLTTLLGRLSFRIAAALAADD